MDVNNLIKILNRQKKLLEELNKLAGEQLQAIKQDSPEEITAITARQEYSARQLALLEEQRNSVIEEYSQKIGMEIKNFSELLLHLKSDDREEIKKIRDDILAECHQLDEANELNTLLLKQSLRFSEHILEILNGRNFPVYGRSGDVHRAGGKRLVDTNV